MTRLGFTTDEDWLRRNRARRNAAATPLSQATHRVPPASRAPLQWNPMLRGSQLRLRWGPITVDVLRARDDHDRGAFRRRRRRRWERHAYWFVAPEDLVLQKLKVGRPRDFEDAAGVVQRLGPALDAAYLRRWATRLGIAAELEYVLSP